FGAAMYHCRERALGARAFARVGHRFSFPDCEDTDGPRTVTRRGEFFKVTGGNGPSVGAQSAGSARGTPCAYLLQTYRFAGTAAWAESGDNRAHAHRNARC